MTLLRTNKHWTKYELNQLFILVSTDTKWSVIAATLHRPVTACYSKAQTFRLIELITYGKDEETLTSIPKLRGIEQ